MKLGIKEFRERISELAIGDETIVITHHGKRVGRYIPDTFREPKKVDIAAWRKEREDFGRRWRASTPDWRERLRAAEFTDEEIRELEDFDRCS